MTLSEKLEAIAARVGAGRIGSRKPWGGADLVISATPSALPAEPTFYPEPRYVVTPHSRELSWLFESLGDAFSGVIDFQSKHEFYSRLADAAEHYQSETPAESRSARGVLLAVLREARALASEYRPEEAGPRDPAKRR